MTHALIVSLTQFQAQKVLSNAMKACMLQQLKDTSDLGHKHYFSDEMIAPAANASWNK